MSRSAIFWMLMILMFILMVGSVSWTDYVWLRFAPGIMVFILLALLGWKVYGPAVKGD